MVDRSKTPARREAMRGEVAEFVRRRLARSLGWGEKPFTMRIPSGGAQSVLYIAEPEGGPPVLVRVMEDAASHARHWRALDEAARGDAPTPRCLYRGTGWLDKLVFGNRFIAESFVPGDQLDHLTPTPGMMHAAARALAALHRIQSHRWGFVNRPERKTFESAFRRRVERRLGDLAKGGNDFDAEEIRKMEAWFNERLDAFKGLREFQLCHMNPGNDDILYDEATQKVSFVDCGTMEYSRASQDLAGFQPFMKKWIGTTEAHREFIEEYLRHSPPGRRGELEREADFFAAYLLLSRVRQRGGYRAAAEGREARPADRTVPQLMRHLKSMTGLERAEPALPNSPASAD